MPTLNQATLQALASSAAAAARYLDACDAGTQVGPVDPGYYRACGDLLIHVFSLLDADNVFPQLVRRSVAARELAESVQITRRLEISRGRFYPLLVALLKRASM